MTQHSINAYGRQLTPEQIAAGAHRAFVGGMWEVIGALQLRFLQENGLERTHRLLDVGCGALRGGIHFVQYLDRGHYFGIDINNSLILAGQEELSSAGLLEKEANLLVNDEFDFGKFGQKFDFAIAVSLFTHLPFNNIIRCLVNIESALTLDAKFYATFFQAPDSAHLSSLTHEPGGTITHYDKDPYHYSFDEIRFMASVARLQVDLIGAWGHPRSQQMLCFRREHA